MNLDLAPLRIELVYADGDTNAANFHLPAPGSYFCIQACVYLEDDAELNVPYFELDDQSNSHYCDVEAVTFFRENVVLSFADDSLFLDKYKSVTLHCNAPLEKVRTYRTNGGAFLDAKYASAAIPSHEPVDRTLVDFFANHLFLGAHIRYGEGFPEESKVSQTSFREPL